mgnify:CR=1 FL=1
MNLNILVQSDIFEIALTAVLTTSLTYWLTGWRDKNQLSIDNKMKALENVYAPIIKR